MLRPTPQPLPRDLRSEFEELALPIVPSLTRTARRLARPPHDANDLVQDALLRAFQTFGNFAPGSNGKAWLFTILYSVAANIADKERRHPAVSMDGIDERFSAAVANGAAHDELARVRQLDASRHVDAALECLCQEFKGSVVLVDLEELTYEEAAAVLGCPVGTLRSRLFRGRKQLFVELRAYARDAGLLKGEGHGHG
jgi:RNA polymerase sigma-70 factor (ECF subfamily)